MKMSLADLQGLRPNLQPDHLQILAHENTAALDPFFNEANFITLPASSPQSVVVKFTLPAGMMGILRAVAMQTQDPNDINSVQWAVRFNGNPIQGLDKIIGQMSSFLLPLNVDMAMYDGYVVDIVAANLTAFDIAGAWAMVRGNFFGRTAR